jgi:hypothetical protein
MCDLDALKMPPAKFTVSSFAEFFPVIGFQNPNCFRMFDPGKNE